MANTVPNDLIADVAREVVRRAAPDELVFFSAAAQSFFTGRDKPGGLDYHGQEAVELLTPVILPIVSGILGDLAVDGTKAAFRAAVAKLRALFHVGPPQRDPIVLDADALAALHERIVREALERKVGVEKAKAIADAVIVLTATEPR